MEQLDFDRAGTASVSFLEELYSEFQKNPENVSADWREYFQSIADTNGDAEASVVAIAALRFRRRIKRMPGRALTIVLLAERSATVTAQFQTVLGFHRKAFRLHSS